ncbi:MAG: hypothetical protein AAF637_24655, partial [Pseudomonadota bacterium]
SSRRADPRDPWPGEPGDRGQPGLPAAVDLLGLFCIAMAMLLLPKLMGLAIALGNAERRNGMGGAGIIIRSAMAEMIFSALLAPILMLRQTAAVIGILMGDRVNWSAQARGDANESWRQVARSYGTLSLIGVFWTGLTYLLTPQLLPWLIPVLLGLVLALPLAMLSGSSDLGLAAARRGWFLVPEEIRPPPELAWLKLEAASKAPDESSEANQRHADATGLG